MLCEWANDLILVHKRVVGGFRESFPLSLREWDKSQLLLSRETNKGGCQPPAAGWRLMAGGEVRFRIRLTGGRGQRLIENGALNVSQIGPLYLWILSQHN